MDTIFTLIHTIGWFSTLFLRSVEMCISVDEWDHKVIVLFLPSPSTCAP